MLDDKPPDKLYIDNLSVLLKAGKNKDLTLLLSSRKFLPNN